MNIEVGKTYEVECPFVRTTWTQVDEDGATEVPAWKPGVAHEMHDPDGASETAIAHGKGKVLYTVVSIHELPKPYKPRIYFVREWIDPDGKRWGRKNLRIMGDQAFRRRLRNQFAGLEYGYELRPDPAAPCGSAVVGESQ